MSTYRKFDRIRARSAFATDIDHFNTYVANKWISTGTGTPANALGTNGGLNIVTSAAANDTSLIQRGIETAGTKLVSIPLRKGRKVAAVARFEHANFTGITAKFGLAPALTDPFAGSASLYMTLSETAGAIVFGATTINMADTVNLVSQRDKFGGVNLEIYFDGQRSIKFYVNGIAVGGFKVTFDANGFVTGFTAPLALSAGVLSTTATAKTVSLRTIGSSMQIAPDGGVPAQQV